MSKLAGADVAFGRALGGRGFGVNGAGAPAVQKPPAPRPLRDGEVQLGQAAGGGAVGLHLGKLIEGRLLIQGNSGAGKSMLLRRIFEQAFGLVQQVLVDPDGEFSTLADNFDVAVLGAADLLRVGGHALALNLRQHRYSAVLDLSDATSEQRLAIVADLSSGLIDAPAEHWHPLLLLVDEAQTFAPYYDAGDVEADTRKRAIAALADIMARGRKRGIAGVIATQRLAETSKAVVSKATNVIVGRTVFDRDLERAGAILGFTAGGSRPLRTLKDGEFICLGPALGGPARIRFKAGSVISRHKGEAPKLAPPPTMSAAQSIGLLRSVPAAQSDAPAIVTRKPGRRGMDWLQEWDAIVRRGYAAGTSLAAIGAELAEAGLQISTSGLSTRAHQLGLVSEKATKGWSDEEDKIVRDAYAREVRIIDIVGLLEKAGFHRGRVSVQMRAIALGITRDRVNYWTEPEKKIAIEGLKDGTSYREIVAQLRAAGFERGMTSILKFAQRHNFSRAVESWTLKDIEELKRLYAKRIPVKEIAEKLGKPIASVRSRASNLGLKQRTPWSTEEYEALRRAHERGASLAAAAQEIGRPYPNVARVAADIGLSFASHRRAGA
jgi:hypothetical protein